MFTNQERVVKETHDENKRIVYHDFIDSNVGLNTHHDPNIGMRKFDDKDPIKKDTIDGAIFRSP